MCGYWLFFDGYVHHRDLHLLTHSFPTLRSSDLLDIPAGQTVSIIGPSGSGKSTLLRLLMTLDRPTSGEILIDGESMWVDAQGRSMGPNSAHVRRVRGKIGMVFQHFNLFPHKTALGNVMEAPIYVAGVSRGEATQRAREYLEQIGRAHV